MFDTVSYLEEKQILIQKHKKAQGFLDYLNI